jgi:hypothetical protein
MTRRGPRTSEGKAASSRNATTHGLTDAPVVRQVEPIEDWEYHLEQVIASLEPEGCMEAQLAVSIAEILWRQRRIPQYEADKISLSLDQMPADYQAVSRYGAPVTRRPIEKSFTLDKIKMQTSIRMLPNGDTLQRSPVTSPTSTASSSRPSTSSKPCRPVAKANKHHSGGWIPVGPRAGDVMSPCSQI